MITDVQAFCKLSSILAVSSIIIFSRVCIPMIENLSVSAKSKTYFLVCTIILLVFHIQAHVFHPYFLLRSMISITVLLTAY